MKRRMISRLSVLMVLIVFMAGCSKQVEYTNAIPADATAVVSINLKSLIDKAGLKDKENEGIKQKMMDALKSGMNAATFQQVEKVIENPSESGIDVNSPIYLFSSVSFPYTTVLAKISNADKLHATLEVMSKEQICQQAEEGDGFSYAVIPGKGMLAFNNHVALMVDGSDSQMEAARQAIPNLLKQTAESSVATNTGFRKMQSQKGDVNFFAAMASIPNAYARQINFGLPTQIDMKDLMVVGNLGFEKGKIALQCETYSDKEEVNALLKKQEKAVTKLSSKFLKNFPESTLAFLNFGANGAELYNILNENPDFRKNISIAKADEVKALFDSFNGDISVGLINVTMNSAPTFAAYADVKNASALKALYDNKQQLNLRRGEDIIQLSENEYVYKSKEMNVFFGVRDNQMYATNDELLYKSIGKPVDKSIKDTAYASDMKGKTFFFVVNMGAILDLPVVKLMTGFGGEEYQTYYKLASEITYLEAYSEGNGLTEIDLCLKNKDTNSLKQIVDFARQFAGM